LDWPGRPHRGHLKNAESGERAVTSSDESGSRAAETLQRARSSGLIIAAAAAVLVPAWAGFDILLVPRQARAFITVRCLCDIPLLFLVWALARKPIGWRRPELLTFAAITVVQAEIAWMLVRVDSHRDAYVMGFSLALFASGCVLGGRPRWTGAVVVTTWLALAASLVTAPKPLPSIDLLSAGFYLTTASIIALVAHTQRARLTDRELLARHRLEREQHQTHQLLERVRRLSNEDYLTGLANRRRWDFELKHACEHARAKGEPVAVLLIDIDRFKDFNDRHGHGCGDQVLKTVADFLAFELRGRGLLARLGGDEFGILLRDTDAVAAGRVGEQLRRAARKLHPLDSPITLSVGVAAAAGDETQPERLISRADGLLYRAKATRDAMAV
jgi:diguanylate cyclase (GGDEF)-like protein